MKNFQSTDAAAHDSKLASAFPGDLVLAFVIVLIGAQK